MIEGTVQGTVTQRNHYYPFGTAFADTPKAEQGKQPYKYNGKDLDDLHGLNLYDYSARYYESAVGRFTSVDPLAEKYYSISPYVYVMNNPLKYIDPDGREKINGYQRNDSINYQAAEEYIDDDAIHIFGHGNSQLLQLFINGEEIIISNAADLLDFLGEHSKTWQNNKDNDQLTIVLHACNSAGIVSKGQNIAENISQGFANDVIVGASDYLYNDSEKGYKGIYTPVGMDGNRNILNINTFNTSIPDESKPGHWKVYKQGKQVKSIKGKISPSHKDPSLAKKIANRTNPIYMRVKNIF